MAGMSSVQLGCAGEASWEREASISRSVLHSRSLANLDLCVPGFVCSAVSVCESWPFGGIANARSLYRKHENHTRLKKKTKHAHAAVLHICYDFH